MMRFYSDNTLITRIFGVSVINKQLEDENFKVLSVMFEVMSGNLQNIGVKQLYILLTFPQTATEFSSLTYPQSK